MELTASKSVQWNQPRVPAGIKTEGVFIGPDPFGVGGFQIAIANSATAPSRQALRDLFNARRGKTQVQLVVVVVHGDTAHMFGPDPQAQPIEMPTEQAQRQLQSVLDEADVLAAAERLVGFRKAHDSTAIAGFTNSGLFATHHITQNVPGRPGWESLNQAGNRLLSARGQKLIQALGFYMKPASGGTVLLSTATDAPRAVAVLLDDTEHFESRSQRFQLSPVAYGLAVATQQEVPWLVVLRKDQIRLYPGRDGVGVGSKGQAETYFEIDLSTVDASYAGLLPLIFTAEALAPDGTTDQLLDESARYATKLGERLRERIYDEIIPPLAVEVTHQLAKSTGLRLDAEGLATAYRVTLRILFRLLFQAYAEDRGLLPSGRNEGFDANSLKRNAQRLISTGDTEFGDSVTLWFDLVQVWDAIDCGNPQWQIPAYNGGLFSSDPKRSPDGALFTKIKVPDQTLGPALKHLLVDTTKDGVEGAVDFRSLSVREFGTIYEGLLESSLSKAEQDLTLDRTGAWVPAMDGDEVHAHAGGVFFHTASGERKATGSYFTPKIVVDHLIERSVVPALTVHLGKIAGHLTKGDAAAAAREFFDFRVADLAMGSGHFLVATVDKIEALMRTFLAQHSVPGVTDELLRLANVAKEALGSDDVAKSEVDEIGLLRRQVARRCIYGLDLNPMAVELARLALWIHTFVPGLPMSNLDHGLVNANSLTGIGTVEEALVVLQPDRAPGQDGFFDEVISDTLASAKTLLGDLANAGEANKAEVEESTKLLEQARVAAAPTQRIFDVAVAARVGAIQPGLIFTEADVCELAQKPEVAEAAEQLRPAHMPVLFPEVFLRANPGFDVLLGNPPWEKAKVETTRWWALRFPGLRSLPQAEQDTLVEKYRETYRTMANELDTEAAANSALRNLLIKGPYPGIGKGDPDLYLAFAWRNRHLLRKSGRAGLVMPRSLLSEAGGAQWRNAIFDDGEFADVTMLVNSGRWAFDMEPRYTIALLSIGGSRSEGTVRLAGPYYSAAEFQSGRDQQRTMFPADDFRTWGTTGAFPMLPSPESGEVFLQLHQHPRLDMTGGTWRVRPYAELHASSDKPLMDLTRTGAGPGWPVYKGESFDLWEPDTGVYYARCNPVAVRAKLHAKRQRPASNSPFREFSSEWWSDPDTLPCLRPRIALRLVSRATDSRTVRAALVPPQVLLTHGAPYLLIPRGTARDEAYLLGVMCSIPFDWNARRVIEVNMTYGPLNSFPVPRPDDRDTRRRRVVEVAGRLAAVDDRYAEWAAEVGIPVEPVQTDAEKGDLIAELDALVSLLYGLTEDQVEHVFATFHRGWNYGPRLEAVLQHYAAWKGKG